MAAKLPETEQQEKLIELFVKGVAVADAAKEVGYSNTAAAYRVLRLYKDHVIELIQNQLMYKAPKAINVLGDSMEEGATEPGANTRIEAAKQVLDRIGIVKKEKVEVEATHGGIFFLPAKAPEAETSN
jgi:hypothetical protein